MALEIYKERKGKIAREQVIFSSPIVLFSWDPVTQALVKAGVVKKEGVTYYIADFPGLAKMITACKKWAETGLPDLYGRVAI